MTQQLTLTESLSTLSSQQTLVRTGVLDLCGPKWCDCHDKKQIANAPHTPVVDTTTPTPCQSNPNLQLKVAGWKSWAYTDDSCQVQDGKTVIGAGVYHPVSDSKNLVEPNGVNITNTIGRAELAAIAAALTSKYAHIATDSLSSLHQLKQQILNPEKHRHHVQGDVLKTILNPCPHLKRSHIFQ
eukprot:1143803-Pelagomonas_calceolata.AAC.1